MVSFLGAQRIEGSTATPASSAPVTLTSGGANAKGAWAELIPATSLPASWLIVTLSRLLASDALVDIAIGASGSEVVIAANLPVSSNTTSVNPTARYMLPLEVPAGTRISARSQASVTTRTLLIQAQVASTIAGGERGLGGVETLGVNTGTSRATAVDPGGTANTKGTWTEIAPATSFPYRWVNLYLGHPEALATTASNWLVDLAVGASGSEQVVIADQYVGSDSTNDAFMEMAYPFPLVIPAGTRVAARCQANINTATERNIDVALIGVG